MNNFFSTNAFGGGSGGISMGAADARYARLNSPNLFTQSQTINVTSPTLGSENLVLQGYGVNITILDDDGTTVRGQFNSGRWFANDYNGGGNSQTCCLGVAAGNGLGLGNGSPIGWASTSYFYGVVDLTLSRAAAASLQLGINDATTPTAQTIKAHDVTTGTGAKLTLAGGKGSVAGGPVVLATSTTSGAATARLTVKASGVINIAGVPTSSSGLASGDIYSNAGILTVVP